MKLVNNKSSEKSLAEKPSKSKINPREIQKSYLDKMEDSAKGKGVILFEPKENLNIDTNCLVLPLEITEISSKDLGEYLNAFTQQKMYLRTLLGRAELVEEEARRNYCVASQEYYRRYSADKISETAKDRLINFRPEVLPLYTEYSDSKRSIALIQYSISNIEDAIFMLSREVTRRTGDFAENMRNDNVQRR